MNKLIACVVLICCSLTELKSQNVVTPSQLSPKKELKNIWSEKIFSDSLSTSTLIWIKESIRLHKHEFHTEHVYILEGSGDMQIGGDNYSVVAGDLVIIPKNTAHSLVVTSKEPIKVISFQSPEFFGKDRFIIEEKP